MPIIILALTVSLNLPGIGWRTAEIELNHHFDSMTQCQAAADGMKDINTPVRHVVGVCREST